MTMCKWTRVEVKRKRKEHNICMLHAVPHSTSVFLGCVSALAFLTKRLFSSLHTCWNLKLCHTIKVVVKDGTTNVKVFHEHAWGGEDTGTAMGAVVASWHGQCSLNNPSGNDVVCLRVYLYLSIESMEKERLINEPTPQRINQYREGGGTYLRVFALMFALGGRVDRAGNS